MRVLFRADASYQMGAGHVMRCLTLAEALQPLGVEATFICRELPGNMCDYLERRRTVRVLRLPAPTGDTTPTAGEASHARLLGVPWQTDAQQALGLLDSEPPVDWLVVDHYALDRHWEHVLRAKARNLMAIDDIADRPHDSDLLLDQNLWDAPEARYRPLVPESCRQLFGPHYALLRPEFAAARSARPQRDGSIRRVLVFFGGTDPTNETTKAVEALRQLEKVNLAIDVVIGAHHADSERIAARVASLPGAHLHIQTQDMARLMAEADLALGAGGSASWERCCLGLPSLMVSVAQNQEGIAEACDRHSAGIYLGPAHRVTVQMLRHAVQEMLDSPLKVRSLSQQAHQLVDGLGASRIVEAMRT